MCRTNRFRRRYITAAILLVALGLRLHAVSFGLPALNDPDELMFELGAVRMLRGATLNPGWFGHPATTTMYVLALIDIAVFGVAWLAGWVAGPAGFAEAIWLNPGLIVLPGRVMIVLCGVLTVALTARLGERLFDRRTGLAAAAFLAIDPVHILWSQVIRSDIMASMFLMLCLLSTLKVAHEGKRRDTLLAGLWVGLAVATKWPFAAASLGMAGVVMLRIGEDSSQRNREILRVSIFGTAALATLVIASPFLLIDYPTVARNLVGTVEPYHLGATGGSPLWNLGWYLAHPLRMGLGLVGLALTLIGLVLAARHREARAILAPPAAGFLIMLLVQRTVWDRWALPLFPILAIIGAWGAVWLIDKVTLHRARGWKIAATIVMAIAAGGPLLATDIAQARERLNDTRQQASRWAEAHIPPNKSVLLEHFAFDLVRRPNPFLFPLAAAGCVDAMSLLKGKIAYSTVDRLRQTRSNIDIGTVAHDKFETCRADYAITTQFDRYAAERERFPAEYAQYRNLLAGARQVAVFAPRPGAVGGPVTRIFKLSRPTAPPR